MAYLRLTFVLIIGVLQVCTANEITSGEESELAKLFSAEELQIAKNAGIESASLVKGKSKGLTFEQMIKLNELINNTTDKTTFEFAGKFCHILDPEYKTATTYTSAQETILSVVSEVVEVYTDRERTPIILSTICNYISQPDLLDMEANSFGISLPLYVIVRHFKMKAQKASGVERVQLAKEFCCVYKSLDKTIHFDQFKFSDLADDEMIEFGEHWNRLETANNLSSIKNVCDFLDAKSPTDKCK